VLPQGEVWRSMSITFNPSSLITGIFDPGPAASAKQAPFELRAGPFVGYELEVISFRGSERVNDVYAAAPS
jgi:hypothetical protein